jgi:hypothetical protein
MTASAPRSSAARGASPVRDALHPPVTSAAGSLIGGGAGAAAGGSGSSVSSMSKREGSESAIADR